jgi:hypothetical protein
VSQDRHIFRRRIGGDRLVKQSVQVRIPGGVALVEDQNKLTF